MKQNPIRPVCRSKHLSSALLAGGQYELPQEPPVGGANVHLATYVSVDRFGDS